MKQPANLLPVEIILVLLGLLVGVIDVHPEGALLHCAIVAFLLTAGVICGLAAWKHLSKWEKVSCGIFLAIGIALLPGTLLCCWDHIVHPRHYTEWAQLEHSEYVAESEENYVEAERLLKIIVQKEKTGWFPGPLREEVPLASVLECEGKLKEAEEVYLSTLKRMESDPKERVTDYAEMCVLNLALLYVREKRYTESIPLLKEAMLRHRKRGTRSWESVLEVDDYLKCIREKGRRDEAEALEKEIHAIGIEIDGRSDNRQTSEIVK